MLLIDKYLSVFINPNFTVFLDFLSNVTCLEKWVATSNKWFWKILCNDFVPKTINYSSEASNIDIQQKADQMIEDKPEVVIKEINFEEPKDINFNYETK